LSYLGIFAAREVELSRESSTASVAICRADLAGLSLTTECIYVGGAGVVSRRHYSSRWRECNGVSYHKYRPAARRAGGSAIAMQVGAQNVDAASGVAGALNSDDINTALAQEGLPAASILSAPVIAAIANFENISLAMFSVGKSSSFCTRDVGPLKMWIWIAIGGGVVLMCCCGSILLLCCRRKKKITGDDDQDDKTKQVDIENNTKLEPIENASTLTGDLVFQQKSSSDKEDEGEDEDAVEDGAEEVTEKDAEEGGVEGGQVRDLEKPKSNVVNIVRKRSATLKWGARYK